MEECVEAEEELSESKASMRLGKTVEAMISQLDSTLLQLEKNYIVGGTQDLASAQDGLVSVYPPQTQSPLDNLQKRSDIV